MRPASDEYRLAAPQGVTVWTRADIYYDGRLVVGDLPVTAGSITYDDGEDAELDVTFTIPRMLSLDEMTTTDLLPRKPLDPLNTYGQVARLLYSARLPSGRVESFPLGAVRLQSWSLTDAGGIELAAAGPLQRVKDDRFLYPVSIPSGSRFVTAVEQIIDNHLPVVVDAALRDRATGTFAFEDERLDALESILDAWPARKHTDDHGILRLYPPHDDDGDAVAHEVTDGHSARLLDTPRLVDAPLGGDREGHVNAVRASGEDTEEDVDPVSYVAYVHEGPTRWNGPFGNIAYFMASPLITTDAQAKMAAETRLANLRRVSETRDIAMVPDVTIERGDLVRVRHDDERTFVMRVSAVEFPLTHEGEMNVSGGVLAGRR